MPFGCIVFDIGISRDICAGIMKRRTADDTWAEMIVDAIEWSKGDIPNGQYSRYGNRNLQHYPFQLLRSRFRSGKFQRCGCKSLYRKAVSFVAARGISTGTGNGNFSPQANLTRSMLVTILYRLENEPETNTSSLFRDVLPDLWYSDAVNWTSLS